MVLSTPTSTLILAQDSIGLYIQVDTPSWEKNQLAALNAKTHHRPSLPLLLSLSQTLTLAQGESIRRKERKDQ